MLSPFTRAMPLREDDVFAGLLELVGLSVVGADAGRTADKLIAPFPPAEESWPLSDSLTSE